MWHQMVTQWVANILWRLTTLASMRNSMESNNQRLTVSWLVCCLFVFRLSVSECVVTENQQNWQIKSDARCRQLEKQVEELKGVKGDLESESGAAVISYFSLSLIPLKHYPAFCHTKYKKTPYNLTWLTTFLKRWQLYHTVHALKCKNAERQIAEDQAFCCMQYRKPYQLRDFDAMTTSYILLVHVPRTSLSITY